MANDGTDKDEGKTSRVRSVKYTYINLDGSEDDSFSEDVAGVVANMLDKPGSKEPKITQQIIFTLADLWDVDLTAVPPMVRMAAVSGLKNTMQNAANAQGINTPAEAAQAIEARRDGIIEGEWRDDTRGGPNLKYVIEAVAAVLRKAKGKEATPAVLLQIKADAKSKGTKFFLDKPAIRAEYDAAAVKRATEAAAASAAAAGKTTDSLDDVLADYA